PAVLHALVLAAVALVVLHRPEDLRAEQAVAFRLERAVVDRLGLLHLTARPLLDLVGRGQRDADRAERERVLGLLEEAEGVLHGRDSSGRWAARRSSAARGTRQRRAIHHGRQASRRTSRAHRRAFLEHGPRTVRRPPVPCPRPWELYPRTSSLSRVRS